MIRFKKIVFFLFLILLNNCSLDNKTGIWNDSDKEKKKVEDLIKEQNKVVKIKQIYSSDKPYKMEKISSKLIIPSKVKNNLSWIMTGSNYENDLQNIMLPSAENIFLKKKIGKSSSFFHPTTRPILAYKNNLIISDYKGTIYNVNQKGKKNWKKNIYKKTYKYVHKNLVFSIYKGNIYVADNLGFFYSLNLNTGKVNWVKNNIIPFKSNMKVFDEKIYLIDQDNKIVCFKTKDGTLVWDLLSISSFIKSQNLLSLASSVDNDLYAITSAADVFKIQGDSGQVYWSRNTASSLYADATDFFYSSNILLHKEKIFFSSGNSTFSLDSKTGSTLWTKEVSTIGTPIVSGNNIFLNTSNGYLVILNKDTGEIISSLNILKILKKKDTKITGFIMGSNKIYSITLNGYLIKSSAITGKAESYKKIGNRNVSPLIIIDQKLYFLSEKAKIFGLN